jgi:hypothetical protein
MDIISLNIIIYFIYLFVVYLTTFLSNSGYIASNEKDFKFMINWKGFGRKRSRPNLRYHLGIFPGGTEKNHERIQSSWSLDREFNPGPSEYEAELLNTRP